MSLRGFACALAITKLTVAVPARRFPTIEAASATIRLAGCVVDWVRARVDAWPRHAVGGGRWRGRGGAGRAEAGRRGRFQVAVAVPVGVVLLSQEAHLILLPFPALAEEVVVP